MPAHEYNGLRAYHARNPNPARLALSAKLAERGHSKAFAMLSVDQVLAGLSDQQRAELATKIHPKSVNASAAAIKAQGFKEANARFAKVTASDHYAGREKFAAHLLSHEALSAAEIIECLRVAPSGHAVDPQLAEDKRLSADRADLHRLLEAGPAGNSSECTDGNWAAVYDEIAQERGL